MRTIFGVMPIGWLFIIFPLVVFMLSLVALFGLREIVFKRFAARIKTAYGSDTNTMLSSLKGSSAILCLTTSLYLGLLVSQVPDAWKHPIGSGLWTLLIIALSLVSINLGNSLVLLPHNKMTLPKSATLLTRNVVRVVIIVIAVLLTLGVWGVPTIPILLLIAILLTVAIFGFRDVLPNLFAGLYIAATQEIKAGDYIKTESQEGYISDIGWSHTHLQNLDGARVIIPNFQIIRQKVTNYRRPPKKATEPFYFKTLPQVAELTGLKARNLQEMVKILKEAPEAVIYYHTHHFLGEQYCPVAHPSSDFALWVKDALENQALAQRLTSINVNEFPDMEILRDKIVHTIEEYLSEEPNENPVKLGREFNFMKSVRVVLPTDYMARDLREFVEALRKISQNSLYFHVFESRSRWGNGTNDFSLWLEKSLGEHELSREISGINLCSYSLEELRSLMVHRIEKSIK